jgi:hypothetical protein
MGAIYPAHDSGQAAVLIVTRSCGIEQAAFVKAMERATVQQRLIQTEEQIVSAEHQIAQQRKVIAEIESSGRSAAHAKYLLAGLELLRAARRESISLRRPIVCGPDSAMGVGFDLHTSIQGLPFRSPGSGRYTFGRRSVLR